MGSFPGQKSPGKYIDETLYDNLKILAKRIVDDMTFLGVCFSSTLEVGTGKSTMISQIGESWTQIMKDMHGIDVPFDIKNCVFRPKELPERAFKLPKYSFVFCDEWEDAHYWSELSMALRTFFRKCRQLNLFMIIIIPNYFQLPINYAVSRSVFAIDVKFENEFERGYFCFYNFQRKKDLYMKGKKFHDYGVCKPNFIGRFTNGYGLDEKEYRKAKYNDMIRAEEDAVKELSPKDIKIQNFQQVYSNLSNVSLKKLSEAFGISERTGNRWLKYDFNKEKDTPLPDTDTTTQPIHNLIDNNDNDNEEGED